MNSRPDPEAMEEYFTDCACLPDPLQPHRDLARTPPAPHLPRIAGRTQVTVPDRTRSMVEGISPFV